VPLFDPHPFCPAWPSSILLSVLSWLPLPLFNRWRQTQAEGGVLSPGVRRLVPDTAADEVGGSALG
jgi:hypothetical protein